MTDEEYAKHKQYAGEAKPSMNRRRVGHDYRELVLGQEAEAAAPPPQPE